jgi:hypothetical protein
MTSSSSSFSIVPEAYATVLLHASQYAQCETIGVLLCVIHQSIIHETLIIYIFIIIIIFFLFLLLVFQCKSLVAKCRHARDSVVSHTCALTNGIV